MSTPQRAAWYRLADPAPSDRLLGAASPDLQEHIERNGHLPLALSSDEILALLADSGLTGRGGAGFPAWRKMAAVRASGRTPVVVANGAEGEPASSKDAFLLRHAPHLVLDGLALAAKAVGADRSYVYTTAGPFHDVRRALADRSEARIDPRPVEVVEAADRFVSGEESAVVAALEGRPGLPRDTPLRVTERGVRKRPTLVHNVETLAHLALIARRGAGWYRDRGTAEEPGTFLASVSGAVERPGVVELPHGVPLAQALAAAGGASQPLQAVLVGGYHGTWLPMPQESGRELSRARLREVGASLGAGVLVALPASSCGLRSSSEILTYLAGQSAGQCGPCLNGLPRLAELMTGLAGSTPAPWLVPEISRLTGLVSGRGACHHPDGSARFAASTVRVFAAEITAHSTRRCSSAGRRDRS